MGVRLREIGNINILDLDGRIDINSSDIIETVGWLVSSGKINIIINLENIDVVDYNGLSVLTISYKNVINHKGKMKFMRVPLPVIELLKVTKLDFVFEVYSDEEEAIESFYDQGVIGLRLRRKFQRLDIHMNVKYKLIGEQKKARVFEGKVMNMSAAGIYIYSSYTFPINSVLDLEITLPGGPAPLEANGRVVWLTDKEIQQHFYPGMGVGFTHLTSEKEKAIADFIDKNITHRADML